MTIVLLSSTVPLIAEFHSAAEMLQIEETRALLPNEATLAKFGGSVILQFESVDSVMYYFATIILTEMLRHYSTDISEDRVGAIFDRISKIAVYFRDFQLLICCVPSHLSL
jgi:hypothetical protein